MEGLAADACAASRPSSASTCAPSAPTELTVRVTKMSGDSLELQLSPEECIGELKRRLAVRCARPTWSIQLAQDTELLMEPERRLEELLPPDQAGDVLELSVIFVAGVPADVQGNTARVWSLIWQQRDRARLQRRLQLLAYPGHRLLSLHRAAAPAVAMFLPDSHTRAARKRRERQARQARLGRRGVEAPRRMPAFLGHRFQESFFPSFADVCLENSEWVWRHAGTEDLLRQGLVNFQADDRSEGMLHAILKRMRGPGLLRGVDLMLEGGARIDLLDSAGRNPLHLAAAFGRGLVAELLLRLNRGLALQQTPGGQTPLELACAHLLRRNPADNRGEEDYALARACCGLAVAEAQAKGLPAGSLPALRAALAQAATRLSLLRRPVVEPLTKAEVLRAAALREEDRRRFAEPELWAGWPWAFLSFEAAAGVPLDRGATASSVALGPFAALRRLIVADMLSEEYSRRGCVAPSRGGSRGCPCGCCREATEDLADDGDFVDDFENHKARNQRWQRTAQPRSRRTTRVPWAAAPGGRLSRSSRLARRLPKGRPDCWGRKESKAMDLQATSSLEEAAWDGYGC